MKYHKLWQLNLKTTQSWYYILWMIFVVMMNFFVCGGGGEFLIFISLLISTLGLYDEYTVCYFLVHQIHIECDAQRGVALPKQADGAGESTARAAAGKPGAKGAVPLPGPGALRRGGERGAAAGRRQQ